MATLAPKTASRAHASGVWAAARGFLTAIRPHQWTKNLFVLAPLLFGRRMGDSGAVISAMAAFACFCLFSSAIYVFNDVLDLAADRLHPNKRSRPIAAGELSPAAALAGACVLLAAGFTVAYRISPGFLALVAGYLLLMIAYCVALKRAIVLDAMTIATGFVMRVVGGAIAVSVSPSHWLIVCAFLLALYLAFAKRRQELLALTGGAERHRAVLGEYTVGYLDQVHTLLLAAVVVCYALYTVAPETTANFGTDALIYGTVFVLYGLLRYMALTQNGIKGGDPGKLVLSDPPLIAAIGCWAAHAALVIYWREITRYFRL